MRDLEEDEERRRDRDVKRAEEIVQKQLKKDEAQSSTDGGEVEVQHRLEETSACLAVALVAVEHKISEDETQNE